MKRRFAENYLDGVEYYSLSIYFYSDVIIIEVYTNEYNFYALKIHNHYKRLTYNNFRDGILHSVIIYRNWTDNCNLAQLLYDRSQEIKDFVTNYIRLKKLTYTFLLVFRFYKPYSLPYDVAKIIAKKILD